MFFTTYSRVPVVFGTIVLALFYSLIRTVLFGAIHSFSSVPQKQALS